MPSSRLRICGQVMVVMPPSNVSEVYGISYVKNITFLIYEKRKETPFPQVFKNMFFA